MLCRWGDGVRRIRGRDGECLNGRRKRTRRDNERGGEKKKNTDKGKDREMNGWSKVDERLR